MEYEREREGKGEGREPARCQHGRRGPFPFRAEGGLRPATHGLYRRRSAPKERVAPSTSHFDSKPFLFKSLKNS